MSNLDLIFQDEEIELLFIETIVELQEEPIEFDVVDQITSVDLEVTSRDEIDLLVVNPGLSQFTGVVTSVFGRTGNIVFQPGDALANQILYSGTVLAFNVQDALNKLQEIKAPKSFEKSFTQLDINLLNYLPVVHGLSENPSSVTVYDNLNEIVDPDDITVYPAGIGVYLNSFVPINGVWKVKVGD